MVRTNRIVRNEIESKFGLGIVEEVERYNDARVDALDEYGTELSAAEEHAQQVVFEDLTRLGESDG